MDSQARKEEILAKKAKLEELRRTRALREQEMRKSRQSVGEGSDVHIPPSHTLRRTNHHIVDAPNPNTLWKSRTPRPHPRQRRSTK